MEYKVTEICLRKSGPRTNRTIPKARIYIHAEGRVIWDHLSELDNAPHREYRKQVLPVVYKALALDEGVKVNWSRTAGCPCGCSPGFIVDRHLRTPTDAPCDIHVTIEGVVPPCNIGKEWLIISDAA